MNNGGHLKLDLVNIGKRGNKPDQTAAGSFGAVKKSFRLSRTETTVTQYVQFLNSVARFTEDKNGQKHDYLEQLWNSEMAAEKVLPAQIKRTGDGKSGYQYTIASPEVADLPIAETNWFAAARFANWMHNGQPRANRFKRNPGTESGAYNLNGQIDGLFSRNKNARFWIPSEDEWYKAAYFSGNKQDPSYWTYPTQSNEAPYNGTPPDFERTNSAAYNLVTSSTKLFPAGSFRNSASSFGVLDLAGSLWEWTDKIIKNAQGVDNSKIVRGGSWSLGFLNPGKDVRRDYTPDEVDDDMGFRLASSKAATRRQSILTAPPSAPVDPSPSDAFTPQPFSPTEAQNFIEMVTVGDPGNQADSNGFGDVGYSYRIGKFEITTQQYSHFLNAVASDPEAPLGIRDLWQDDMADPKGKEKPGKLILRTLNDNNTYSYAPAPGRENLPIAWTNWFAAARFANWLHNGATVGADTETGAYSLNGATTGTFLRQESAKYWIPSEDEWYKSAYYDPAKTTVEGGPPMAGYWKYATQSDDLPDDLVSPDALNSSNGANYNAQRRRGDVLTDVGSYHNSPSHYGTFDMSGNLWEWNDAVIPSPTPGTDQPDSRGVRGGSFSQGLLAIASSTRRDYPSGYRAPDGYLFYSDDDTGFRLASAVVADPLLPG